MVCNKAIKLYDAYCRIFDRIGLDYRAVLRFRAPSAAVDHKNFMCSQTRGEDDIVFSDGSDYAANIEKAECVASGARLNPDEQMRKSKHRLKTIEALVNDFGIDIQKTVKTLIVRASDSCEVDFVALILRGDHTLNEVKAENHPMVRSPLTFATEKEIRAVMGAGPGSFRSSEL